MKRCATCETPIEHLHGNSAYCMKCRPDKTVKKSEPVDIWVQIKNKDLKDLERKAQIGIEIEKLDEDTKQTVYKILERFINGD